MPTQGELREDAMLEHEAKEAEEGPKHVEARAGADVHRRKHVLLEKHVQHFYANPSEDVNVRSMRSGSHAGKHEDSGFSKGEEQEAAQGEVLFKQHRLLRSQGRYS